MGSLPKIGPETQLDLIMNDFIAATVTAAETHTTTSAGDGPFTEKNTKKTQEEDIPRIEGWAATG